MPEEIGELLKQAREARKLSIQKAAEATRIRAYFLEAMESGDFESLPSAVQARGFLRLYAAYLGLDPKELVDQFSGPERTVPGQEPEPEPANPVPVSETSPVGPGLQEQPLLEAELTAETEELQDDLEQENQPEVQPDEMRPSQDIFLQLGQELKSRRELLSLTIDEIERHTHVRKVYLHALEAGRFEDLPSPVQARGMLHNYARFLDMDVDRMLLRFADGLQAQRIERHPPTQPEQSQQRKRARSISLPPFLRQFVSGDLVFGTALVVLLGAFVIWGGARILAIQTQQQAESNQPSISDVLLATEAPTLELTVSPETTQEAVPANPEEPTPTAPVPTVFSQARVQVYVIAVERTWMRVTVDGSIKFEGRVQGGSAYPFEGNQQIEILTGNGSALEIIFNQQNMGLMGFTGEVINRIYTPEGVLLPTPTITPVPSATPRVTPTPTRTSTPRPTQPGQ